MLCCRGVPPFSSLLLPALLLSLSFIDVRVEGVHARSTWPERFPRIHRNLPNFSFRSGEVKQITPSKNISKLLDNLLKGYDQKLRPSFGGEPTTVEIDIEVRSMSQISEMDMTYSMDCYFRQSWVDERLAFSDLEEAFTLSVSVLDKLWKPDTYIYNGKKSYVHLITTPNKFIRLYQNGRILYSSRYGRILLQVWSNFAYTTRDVIYRWNKARQVVIASDLMLSQFDLIATPSGFENTTRTAGIYSTLMASFHLRRRMGYFVIQVYAPCVLINVLSWVAFWINREATSDRVALGKELELNFLQPADATCSCFSLRWLGEFSTLLASFHLQRHMGNFMITVYGPCVLLVVLSWVSFWLNREATSDRISLGITTVLTMTFLGLEARTDLPKVPYSTALDLFVWLSYGFIFATIIEFAFVHVFTKVGSGEVYLSEASLEGDSDEAEENEDEEDLEPDTEPVGVCLTGVHQEEGVRTPTTGSNSGPNGVGGSSGPIRTARPTSATPHGISFVSRMVGACRNSGKGPIQAQAVQTIDQLKEVRRVAEWQQKEEQQQQEEEEEKEEEAASQHWRNQTLPRSGRNSKRTAKRLLQMNSVSNIDEISRVLFPLSFLCINFLYWYTFLSHNPWPSHHL
ncbi:gamma-aminobutyric acid receptor alpha-like [Panulirus ornatus]|uniref:gamma-aminobutyric acid receptor alpha-like n=1 Tax=Panulirus ornatus TaxID=150431 RepID=UPI003A876F31